MHASIPQDGWTALHNACSNNFLTIADLLLKKKADPDIINGKVSLIPEVMTISLMHSTDNFICIDKVHSTVVYIRHGSHGTNGEGFIGT